MKLCTKCGENKPLSEYHKRGEYIKKHVYRSECKSCFAKKATDWRRANPTRAKVHWTKSRLKKFYGLELEDYEIMLTKQEGRCAICNTDMKKICVDHCHSTGKVRGLLCQTCNSGIGHLKDDVEIVKKAVAYLEKSSP